MKRDPVLAQLDFLINGSTSKAPRGEEEATPAPEPLPPSPPPPPLLPPLHTPLPAPDPVLSQLDALINGAPAAVAASLVKEEPEEPRGPPGILREYGGVAGWLRARGYAASPTRITPPPADDATNRPSSDQAA